MHASALAALNAAKLRLPQWQGCGGKQGHPGSRAPLCGHRHDVGKALDGGGARLRRLHHAHNVGHGCGQAGRQTRWGRLLMPEGRHELALTCCLRTQVESASRQVQRTMRGRAHAACVQGKRQQGSRLPHACSCTRMHCTCVAAAVGGLHAELAVVVDRAGSHLVPCRARQGASTPAGSAGCRQQVTGSREQGADRHSCPVWSQGGVPLA